VPEILPISHINQQVGEGEVILINTDTDDMTVSPIFPEYLTLWVNGPQKVFLQPGRLLENADGERFLVDAWGEQSIRLINLNYEPTFFDQLFKRYDQYVFVSISRICMDYRFEAVIDTGDDSENGDVYNDYEY
jgi:hypothetical protein